MSIGGILNDDCVKHVFYFFDDEAFTTLPLVCKSFKRTTDACWYVLTERWKLSDFVLASDHKYVVFEACRSYCRATSIYLKVKNALLAASLSSTKEVKYDNSKLPTSLENPLFTRNKLKQMLLAGSFERTREISPSFPIHHLNKASEPLRQIQVFQVYYDAGAIASPFSSFLSMPSYLMQLRIL